MMALSIAVLTGLWYLPPIHLRITAAAAVARAIGLPVPGPIGTSASYRWATLSPGLEGELLLPPWFSPGIVLVPGAARAGARDPRLLRVATALARTGRVVFVPQMDLRHRVFRRSDLDRIVEAVLAVRRLPVVDGSVGIVGISTGGSFALIAAADRRIASRVAFVGVFGAYLDLRHVIQGVTTLATTPQGRLEHWTPDPRARGILVHQAEDLLGSSGDDLARALKGREAPSGLPPEALAMYRVLENRDPRRALSLIEELPSRVLARLGEFSPDDYLAKLRTPVAILQSTRDPTVPPSEATLLSERLHAPLYVLRHFTHVTPGSVIRGLPDLWGATEFTAWILQRG
jgi:pimeloyl-ACP methyl ester carboxylesterase